MSEPVPIAVAVVENYGRFLIGPRQGDGPLAGLWEFPGGKIRPGESPAAAAARECLEETGVPVRVGALIDERTHEYSHGVVQLHFFACTPVDVTDPQPPFRWASTAELSQFDFPSANAAILRRLVP